MRLIYQVSQVSSIPIIGCGGVMNGEDAIEMILAGATGVQVSTANFVNPLAMTEIIDGVEQYMNDYNLANMNQ